LLKIDYTRFFISTVGIFVSSKSEFCKVGWLEAMLVMKEMVSFMVGSIGRGAAMAKIKNIYNSREMEEEREWRAMKMFGVKIKEK
jgi:hypothetical protein